MIYSDRIMSFFKQSLPIWMHHVYMTGIYIPIFPLTKQGVRKWQWIIKIEIILIMAIWI